MHEFAESDGTRMCFACSQSTRGCCVAHPHINGVPSVHDFLLDVAAEVFRARMLYPNDEGVLAALGEEQGELCKAYISESRKEILKEAIQTCAMAIRVALEGDPSLSHLRAKRGLDI